MIDGAHVVIYSKDAERDRMFFRDVLKFPHVDAGHDWLIFKLPPSEVAMHPSGESNPHELYLICNDLEAEIAAQGRECLLRRPDDRTLGSRHQDSLAGRRTSGPLSAQSPAPLMASARRPPNSI